MFSIEDICISFINYMYFLLNTIKFKSNRIIMNIKVFPSNINVILYQKKD